MLQKSSPALINAKIAKLWQGQFSCHLPATKPSLLTSFLSVNSWRTESILIPKCLSRPSTKFGCGGGSDLDESKKEAIAPPLRDVPTGIGKGIRDCVGKISPLLGSLLQIQLELFETTQPEPRFKNYSCTGPPDRISHRKWRWIKQQPSRARSSYQLSCCLLSLRFLCDILRSDPVQTVTHLMKKIVSTACAHPQNNSSNCSKKIGLGQNCQHEEHMVESSQGVLDEEHTPCGPCASCLPQDWQRLSL